MFVGRRSTTFPTFSADLADDFVVPGGQTWNVESIDADGVHFNGAGPPSDLECLHLHRQRWVFRATPVYSALNQPVSVVGTHIYGKHLSLLQSSAMGDVLDSRFRPTWTLLRKASGAGLIALCI